MRLPARKIQPKEHETHIAFYKTLIFKSNEVYTKKVSNSVSFSSKKLFNSQLFLNNALSFDGFTDSSNGFI